MSDLIPFNAQPKSITMNPGRSFEVGFAWGSAPCFPEAQIGGKAGLQPDLEISFRMNFCIAFSDLNCFFFKLKITFE